MRRMICFLITFWTDRERNRFSGLDDNRSFSVCLHFCFGRGLAGEGKHALDLLRAGEEETAHR